MEISKITMVRAGVLPALLAILVSGAALAQDKVEKIVETGVSRNDAAKESQKRVDQIQEGTDKIIGQYKRELKVVDGLKVYNALLQRQLDDQQLQLQQLKESIEEVSVIERQITPLMLRMLDGLEQFINLDVPFLLEERKNRVTKLKATLERADVTTAEKFRAVLEAFQIENEYGRTIESYKGSLEGREVDFLRVGRVALLYQSVGGQYNGYWDQSQRKFVSLTEPEYRNYIDKGIKIARKLVAPDLIMLPVAAPGGAK